MFNDDSTSIFGGIGRRKKHEQAVIFILPFARLAALCSGYLAHLRRARLSGHANIRDWKSAGHGRSIPIDDQIHAFAHNGEMLRRDGKGPDGLLLTLDQIRVKMIS